MHRLLFATGCRADTSARSGLPDFRPRSGSRRRSGDAARCLNGHEEFSILTSNETSNADAARPVRPASPDRSHGRRSAWRRLPRAARAGSRPRFRSATSAGPSRGRRYRCWTSRRRTTGWPARSSPSATTTRPGASSNQRFELSDAPVRADDDPVAMLSGSGGSRHRAGPVGSSGGPAADARRRRPRARASCCSTSAPGRRAAPAGLSRQRDPCRAVAQHARRCAGAVSGVEEMVALGAGLWLASGGRAAGRCLSPRGASASARAS